MDVTKILSVGIDPAQQSHYVVAMVYPEIKLVSKKIDNSYQAITELDRAMESLALERNLTLVYGLEDTGFYGNAVRDILLDKGRLILEVNPLKTNRQKDFYGQDKSDKVDATCIASIVLRAYDTLPKVTPQNQILEAIRQASRFRQTVVKTRTQNINRLHFQLTRAWMSAYKTLPNLKSRQAIEFFIRFPLPQMLRGISAKELASFLYAASNYRTGNLKKTMSPLEKAKAILEKTKFLKEQDISPAKGIEAEIIRQLAFNIRQLNQSIKAIEKKLSKLLEDTGQKLTTLKGIKVPLASCILGETLAVDRFLNRHEFALYNGTAPREDSTGGRTRHVANRFCNRRLKAAFNQLALTSARCDTISKKFYQAAIKRGLSKNEALKRLSRRLSDIVFAMMKNKSCYDAQIALENMQRRRSYLLKQSEGKMANLDIRDIPQKSGILNEILEPCLTPRKNYTRGKRKIKENIPNSLERIFSDITAQKLALKGSRIKDLNLSIDRCIPKF